MHHNLIQTLNYIVTLNPNEIEFLKTAFKEFQIKKGDYFLKAGELNNKLGFINKGLIRYFVYKNEEESTLEFSKEGEFVAEYQSLVQKSQSIQCVQAIEDTTMLVMTSDDLQILYSNFRNGDKIGRMVIEHRFNVLVNQLMSIYMHNPDQRYLHFINTYPELVQRVPQYHIASYVGVKPQSLSRIRKRFAQ
ncbi:MAG: Crp/Fnr family transcriptional regulator [Lacibacter sp.]